MGRRRRKRRGGVEEGKDEGVGKGEVEGGPYAFPIWGHASGGTSSTFLFVYFKTCLSTCVGPDSGLPHPHSKHDPSVFSLA